MAEKKPTIVIKKITVVAGGAHGGAWKVAFADFMTAMMAFFLVMWLLASSSEAQKKALSDYFSTPSIIEYQFYNYGVELTLEKLFLDLINEPLKTFQSFVEPMDRTPNVMSMGMKKIVMSYMADQLGNMASNVNVTADSVVFEVPDHMLFDKGTANPNAQFVTVMEKVKGVTSGLEDSDVVITSVVYNHSVPNGQQSQAKMVAEQRLDMLESKVKASLESDSVSLMGRYAGREGRQNTRDTRMNYGFVKFEIKQKKALPDGRKPRPLVDGVFSEPDAEKSVYDNFVDQISKKKKR